MGKEYFVPPYYTILSINFIFLSIYCHWLSYKLFGLSFMAFSGKKYCKEKKNSKARI